MAFQIEIHISPELVTFLVAGTDLRRSFPNQVVRSLPANVIPDASDHEETRRLFEGADVHTDLIGLRQLTALMHRELVRARPLAFTFAKLFHQFDYALWLQAGARSAIDAQSLAELLNVLLRVRRLSIDGRDVTIPLWRRNLDYWTGSLLTFFLPVIMVLAAWQLMPGLFQTSALLFTVFLLATLYAGVFVGTGLWLLLTRRLVPAGYRKILLQTRRIGSGGLIARFWLRRLG